MSFSPAFTPSRSDVERYKWLRSLGKDLVMVKNLRGLGAGCDDLKLLAGGRTIQAFVIASATIRCDV